jgi:pyruvate formate-lyase activating enzyme-like uncharacterized protein
MKEIIAVVLSAEKMILANQAEYGSSYPRMRFAAPAEAADFRRRRAELLVALSEQPRARFACQGTKYYSGELSPGCAACGAGQWSCLFINGICNGTCFYCPSLQKTKGEPMTNNLRFPFLLDYLDYVAVFGFSGVSLSGGEPFMTFERTLNHVRKLKKRFGSTIHLWLYTNGILATSEKIALLAEAGLDEIRFDISADNYRLDHVKLAVNRIPRITVEIPAIPEDLHLMREKLAELAAAGVHHLNLHQLRCTPHNLNNFLARGYILTHGPRVVVPESEITALRLLLTACEIGGPSVNYCSFAYKSRYQEKAARMRTASILAAPYEDVTGAGYIRSLSVTGDETELKERLALFAENGVNQKHVYLEKNGRLFFNRTIWPLMDFTGLELRVKYFNPQLRENVSYRGSHKKIQINRKRSLVAERIPVNAAREIPAAARKLFAESFIRREGEDGGSGGSPDHETFGDLSIYERVLPGLQKYF